MKDENTDVSKIAHLREHLDEKVAEYDRKARFILRYIHLIIVMSMIFFIYSFMVETNTFRFEMNDWTPSISIEQTPNPGLVNNTSVIVSTNVARLSILLFSALLVRVFIDVFKYYERLKNFYRARVSAINLLDAFDEKEFSRLVSIMSSDEINFSGINTNDLDDGAKVADIMSKLSK